jgi:sulfur carrier protein ThiS
MRVELNLYANLARYLPADAAAGSGMLDVSTGLTVSELLKQLGIPEDQVKLIFLNGTHANGDTVLEEGCRVGVFPPVGGG